MTHRIALVSCMDLPEPDPDQTLLLGALRDAGLAAELLAWDDPASDPAAFDLCVLRSCWNYYRSPEAFRAWVDRAAARSRLLNPRTTVHWNLDKRYLRELDRAGIPIVPSVWLSRGDPPDLAPILSARGWDDVVLKPSISAASYRTRFFGCGDEGELAVAVAFLRDLLADGDALIQPRLPGFVRPGERALVWIDGELTHAVGKSPRFDGEVEAVSAATPVAADERALATAALEHVACDLLYARVDVVRGPNGGLVVSELELIEPSLFLAQSSAALARFVAAIGARAARAQGVDQDPSIERRA